MRADGAELSEAARLVPSEERQPRGIRPLVLGLQMLAVKRATKHNAAGAGSGDHRRDQHRSNRLGTIVKFVTLRPVTMPSLIAPAFAHTGTQRFSLCSCSLF